MEVPPPAPDVGTPAPCGSGRVYPRHLCQLREGGRGGGFYLGRRSPGGVGGWRPPALPCSERRRGGGKPGEEEPGGKEEGAHISFLNRGFCSNSSELK